MKRRQSAVQRLAAARAHPEYWRYEEEQKRLREVVRRKTEDLAPLLRKYKRPQSQAEDARRKCGEVEDVISSAKREIAGSRMSIRALGADYFKGSAEWFGSSDEDESNA